MSEHNDLDDVSNSDSLLQWVDQIADKFDAAWQSALQGSPPPSLEDYVASIDEPRRTALLHELLPVDVDYRRSRGDNPAAQEYLTRFAFLDRDWVQRAIAPAEQREAQAAGRPAVRTEAKRIRCPHCQSPIQLVDELPEEVLCPSCGSSFRLRDTRLTSSVDQMRQIGKFQLVERRGLGAFGAVWKARDTVLDKVVALKIPHAGSLEAESDRQRFYREARAAAQLRHPGIVAVHEVAELETDSGKLPAIVSDYVDGVTLRELLQTRRLTFRESVTLIAQLAEALDYAHSKGVVHRDIKPANIMIEYPHGLGLGAPLDADSSSSGLSAEGQGLNDEPSNSPVSVLNPSMSRPSLISGRPSRPRPMILDFGLALRDDAEATMTMDGQRLGTPTHMSPEQAAGQSHRVDARSDVYSLGVILYELLSGELPFRGSQHALYRQILNDEPQSPRRTNDKMPRDLETICLKCLEKEPHKRYPTAATLAEELGRFLYGEPIHARPVGNTERLWRWSKRNPRVAVLSASVFLLVLSLAIGSTIGMLVISEQKQRVQDARRAEQQQIVEVQRQKRLVENERDRATQNFQFARDAVSRYYTEVSESTLLNVPRMEKLRRNLLQNAAEFYEKFTAEHGNDDTLHAELGLAYRHLSNITYSIASKEQAIRYLERSRETFQKLITGHPENISYRRDYATTVSNLAVMYNETARAAESLAAYRESLELRQALAEADRTNPDLWSDLGDSWNNLGSFLSKQKKYAEAEPCFDEAFKIRERLAAERPGSDGFRNNLAATLGDLVLLYQDTMRVGLAEEYLQKCLDIRQPLVEEFPSRPEYQVELGKLYNNRGILYRITSRPKEAEQSYRKTIEIRERLAHEHPDVVDYQTKLADIHHNLGVLFRLQGRFDEAQELYEKALSIWQKLADDEPDDPERQSDLARGHNNFGIVFNARQQLERAEQEYRKSISIRERLADRYSDIVEYQHLLAGAYYNLGNMFGGAEQFQQALEPFQKSVAIRVRLVEKQPDSIAYRQYLANARINLAEVHVELRQLAEASVIIQQTIADLEKLIQENPELRDVRGGLAFAYANRGHIAEESNELEDALTWYTRAVDVVEPAIAKNARDVEFRRALFAGLRSRSEVLEKLGRFDEAIRDSERGLEFAGAEKHVCLKSLADCHAKLGHQEKSESCFQQLISFWKAMSGSDSTEYADSLAALAEFLLKQQKPINAEPLLRECLAIREKKQPDDWQTFHVKSLLGHSLTKQKNYTDSEALLLAGYGGMKEREIKMSPEAKPRLVEAIQRIVDLYDAWNKPDKADEWRKKLPEFQNRSPAKD